jgi:hypothetical protein
MLQNLGALPGNTEFYATPFVPGCLSALPDGGSACDAFVLLCRDSISDEELGAIARELVEAGARSIVLHGLSNHAERLDKITERTIAETWPAGTDPRRWPIVNLVAQLDSEELSSKLHVLARLVHVRCGREKITVVLVVGTQETYTSVSNAIRSELKSPTLET